MLPRRSSRVCASFVRRHGRQTLDSLTQLVGGAALERCIGEIMGATASHTTSNSFLSNMSPYSACIFSGLPPNVKLNHDTHATITYGCTETGHHVVPPPVLEGLCSDWSCDTYGIV